MSPLHELKEAVLHFPRFVYRFVLAVIIGILTEGMALALTIFGIALGFATTPLIAVAAAFGLYAVLLVVADWVRSVVDQMNFNSRVIRDNRHVSIDGPVVLRSEND